MNRIFTYVTCLCFCLAASHTFAVEPGQWARANVDDLLTLYYHLHQNPELSLQEEKTGDRLAEELAVLGIEVTQRVGGFGVVGILKNGAGPTLMLRTDTDALPVTENTQVPYASKVRVKTEGGSQVGVMHACGHDIHMTNLVGVARFLTAHKSDFSGTVMFVCQPAEERGAGAAAMLEDGLFERFAKPDFAVALHVDSTVPTGRIALRAGFSLANVDSIDITVRGRGGHGAYPHSTIDPIVQAAQLIVDLQTIVSREIAPTAPAVITVGSIHGGAKHNVIADSCHLQLTIRSYDDKVREHLLGAIRRKAVAVAASFRAPEPIVEISEGTPALRNDDELTARLRGVFEEVLGAENVLTSEPVMGGEDFSRYGRAGVPILMYRLGSVDQRRLDRFRELEVPPPSLHSAIYYPDASDTLVTGVTTMATAVLRLLPRAQ